jgi:DNA-directed RNA polymerase subunit RPC12/RpoP
MISFSCDNCGNNFKVPQNKGGKNAKCPACGHLIHIPSPSGSAPRPLDVRSAADEILQPSHRPVRNQHAHEDAQLRGSLAGRQRANLILLGVILLTGFIIPVVITHSTGARSAEFVNITILVKDRVPVSIKVLALTPAIAGIALLILQNVAKHPLRGSVIIFLAMTPILIILADLQNIGVLNQLESNLPPGSSLRNPVVFLGLFVAPVAMLVGIRSRTYRPDSPIAYWFGVAGAAAWFIFLIAPVLNADNGHMFMMLPVKMIERSGLSGVSMGLLVMMAALAISGAICIINKPTKDAQKARNLAGMAYWISLAGVTVFMLCIYGEVFADFPGMIHMIQFLCLFGGMSLLLPTGITDLVVGRIHHHEHEASRSTHPHTDPPDIPRRAV